MTTKHDEKGFVLATSLVLMLLMTMLTAAVYFGVDASQKSSMAAESATEAFYYAETAANYMAWALANDVDFDSYTYPQAVRTGATNNYTFGEPRDRNTMYSLAGVLIDAYTAGDFVEWRANMGNPYGGDVVGGEPGQVMYYDNTDLYTRAISFQSGELYSSPDGGATAATQTFPDLFEIHRGLPRYIRLDIDSYGTITPAMPPYSDTYPHHGNVMGVDYPENGALVWLTGGNVNNDYAVDPIDVYTQPIIIYDVYGNIDTIDPGFLYDDADGVIDGKYYECTLASPNIDQYSVACKRGEDTWLETSNYGLIVYALGYVNGQARKLIRIVYVQ